MIEYYRFLINNGKKMVEVLSNTPSLNNSPEENNIEIKNLLTSATKIKLDNLKENITIEWVKNIINSLEKTNLSDWDRWAVLSSLITILNHNEMVIEWIGKDKISIHGVDKTKAAEYERILDTSLSSNKIKIEDIQNWMLYKTSEIDNFIKTNNNWADSLDIEKYTDLLIQKYDLEKNWLYTDKTKESIDLNVINHKVTNIHDRTYLLSFFTSKLSKVPFKKDAILDYKKDVSKTEKAVIDAMKELDEETLTNLKVRDKDFAKDMSRRMKTDPFWIVWEMLNKWGSMWVLLWIIWFFMWGTKLGLMWFVLWMWGAAYWSDVFNMVSDKSKLPWTTGMTNTLSTLSTNLSSIVANKLNWIPKKDIDRVTKSLETSTSFKNASIIDLDTAYNSQNRATAMQAFFWNLNNSWIDYNKDKKIIDALVEELLKQKETTDVIIWDLYTQTSNSTSTTNTTVANTPNTQAANTPTTITASVKAKPSTVPVSVLAWFYNINESSINTLNQVITGSKLDLNISGLLDSYRIYIDTNLVWLDKKYLDKIKESIVNKISKITKIIEELKNEEIEKYWTLKNFWNNRWIVNSKIEELFSDLNNEILPSTVLYLKNKNKQNINWYPFDKNKKLEEIQEMLNAEVNEDWDFDEWFWSTQNLFDYTDEREQNMLKSNNISNITDIDLLNPKDKEIQSRAQMWFMAIMAALVANDVASFTWVYTIPWVVIWVAYDAWDIINQLVNDQDAAIGLLKTAWIIPDEYRQETTWIDLTLATLWIIPWATALIKSWKIAKFTSNLSANDLKTFEWIKKQISWIFTGSSKIDKLEIRKQKELDIIDAEIANVNNKVNSHYFIHKKTWDYLTHAEYLKRLENDKLDIVKNYDNLKLQKKDKKYTTNSLNKNLNKEVNTKTNFLKLWNEWKIDELFWNKLKVWEEVVFAQTKIKRVKNNLYSIDWSTNLINKSEIFSKIPKARLKEESIKIINTKLSDSLSKIRFEAKWGKNYEYKKWTWIDITDKNNQVHITDQSTIDNIIETNFNSFFKQINSWIWFKEKSLKVANKIDTDFAKKWIKNVWDYLDSVGFQWDKSKIWNIWDKIAWIVLTPATTMTQLIKAAQSDSKLKDISKILITWNRNNTRFKWNMSSWLARTAIVWTIVTLDDHIDPSQIYWSNDKYEYSDKDTSTPDEVWDIIFNLYGWIINTFVLKVNNIID